MHNKFEINRTKIKGGCQSGRRVVIHNSKSDLPLVVESEEVTRQMQKCGKCSCKLLLLLPLHQVLVLCKADSHPQCIEMDVRGSRQSLLSNWSLPTSTGLPVNMYIELVLSTYLLLLTYIHAWYLYIISF